MENKNTSLLNTIYKATFKGIEATKMIFPKVEDIPLRRQIAQQYFDYQTTSSKIKNLMHYNGKTPKNDKFKKAMFRNSIKLNTMINKTTNHIAELMVGSTIMGIVQVTKGLNSYNGNDTQAKKIAEDFLVNEQRNINELKKHL